MKKLPLLFLAIFSFFTTPLLSEEANLSSKDRLEMLRAESEESEGLFINEFLNMLFVLGGIIALMLVVAWILKRVLSTRELQMNETSVIKVLERRALNPKSALYLVEVHGKGLIIGETPNGLSSLGEIEIKPVATSFDRILEKKKRESESP